MTDHTPTPWVAGDHQVLDAHGGRIAVCNGHVVPDGDEEYQQWQANAAFIVKSVNNHDRFIQALQFVVDGYDNQDVNHVDFRVRVYEVALDALASVAARPFYGAECPSYPNCEGGCGLGCTKEIEAVQNQQSDGAAP